MGCVLELEAVLLRGVSLLFISLADSQRREELPVESVSKCSQLVAAG